MNDNILKTMSLYLISYYFYKKRSLFTTTQKKIILPHFLFCYFPPLYCCCVYVYCYGEVGLEICVDYILSVMIFPFDPLGAGIFCNDLLQPKNFVSRSIPFPIHSLNLLGKNLGFDDCCSDLVYCSWCGIVQDGVVLMTLLLEP